MSAAAPLILQPLPALGVLVTDLGDEPTAKVAVIDTETTGLVHGVHEVVELGMVTLRVGRETGRVGRVGWERVWKREPRNRAAWTDEAMTLTGFKWESVAGQRVDWDLIELVFHHCDFVVAHHARFDFGMVREAMIADHADLDKLNATPWVCSCDDVPWVGRGVGTRNLELLVVKHGRHYAAHGALEDARAVAYLLAQGTPPYWLDVLGAASVSWVRVLAEGSPYERRHALKERRYEWDAARKVWHRTVPAADADAEVAWCRSNAGGSPRAEDLASPLDRWLR